MSRQPDVHRVCPEETCSAVGATGISGQPDGQRLHPEETCSAAGVSGISSQPDGQRLHPEDTCPAVGSSRIFGQPDIHPMHPEEVPAAAAIERMVMGEPWSAEAFLEALDNPCAVCMAAVWEQTGARTGAAAVRSLDPGENAARLSHKENPLVGYCVLYHAADEGEIVTVAVCEEWRRRGIADRLLQTVLRKAHEKRLGSVWLEVRVSNAAAIHLYEKHGFAAAGKRKNFYRAPREDALVMVRRNF